MTETLPTMMKAAIYRRYATELNEIIEYTDVPVPAFDSADEASRNKVLVKVISASINPIDFKIMQGDMAMFIKKTFPAIPGFDVAGVVVKVGKGVTRFKVGEEIYSDVGASQGTLAEYVVINQDLVACKPRNLDYPSSASVPLAALTAYQVLAPILLPLQKKSPKVLVLGGSGGVGTFAIQIARALGAEVTTTCSAASSNMVKALGASRVVDYNTEDWGLALRYQGYELIFDCVGGFESWKKAQTVTRSGGHYVSVVGDGHGKITACGLVSRMCSSANRNFWSIFGYPKYRVHLKKSSGANLDQLRELLESNQVKPVLDRSFPLSDVRSAFQYLLTGRAKGKVVVNVAAAPRK